MIKSVKLSIRVYFKDDEMPELKPCEWDGEKFDTFIRFLVGMYGWEVTVSYDSPNTVDCIYVDRRVKVYTDMDRNVALNMYDRAVIINS